MPLEGHMSGYNYSVSRSKSSSSSSELSSEVLDVTGSGGVGGHGHKFSQFFKKRHKKTARDLLLSKLFNKIQIRVNKLQQSGEKLNFTDLTSELRFLLTKIRVLIDVVRSSINPVRNILYRLGGDVEWHSIEHSMLQLVIANSDKAWLAGWHVKSLEMTEVLEHLHYIITEQLNTIVVKVLAAYRKIIKATEKQHSELSSIFHEIDNFKCSYDKDYAYFMRVLCIFDEILLQSTLYLEKIERVSGRLIKKNDSERVLDDVVVFRDTEESLKSYLKKVFSRSGIEDLTKNCNILNERGMDLLLGKPNKDNVKEIEHFLVVFSGQVENLRTSLVDFEEEAFENFEDKDPCIDNALNRCMERSLEVLESMNKLRGELKSKVDKEL